MVVGTIVGSSIFVQPSEVSRAVPSFAGMLLVWVAAGVLTWFGASICAELTSAYPRAGGVYVFLREMFWSMHSGIIAAIAMVFGRYAATIVPMGDLGIRVTAVLGIVVLSAINYVGVRPGSAEETRNPERTIPRALMVGTAVVVVTYLGLNAAYLLVLPFSRVLTSTHIAYDATLTAAGPAAASAISILVIVSSLGANSGIILAGPRVYYAMAEDGLLFRWMGAVHPT